MIPTYCDNIAAVAIALQLVLSARTKHIEVRMHNTSGLLSCNVI